MDYDFKYKLHKEGLKGREVNVSALVSLAFFIKFYHLPRQLLGFRYICLILPSILKRT